MTYPGSVDARVGRVSGVGRAENIKLQFRINSGLLFLRDSVLHSNMAATLRIPVQRQSEGSPVADSIRRIFSGKFDNKQTLKSPAGVFDMNVHLDFVSRVFRGNCVPDHHLDAEAHPP